MKMRPMHMKLHGKIIVFGIPVMLAAAFLIYYFRPCARAERITNEAIAEGKKGDTVQAQRLLEESISICPGNFLALFNLGILFSAQDRNQEAYDTLKKAERILPGDSSTKYEIARIHARMGKTDEAYDYLVKAVDLGFQDIRRLGREEDFKIFRYTPRFNEIWKRWQAINSGKTLKQVNPE